MTTLYTSSYRAFQPAMGTPIVISLGLPKWRPESADWDRLWMLTPRGSYFGADPDVFDKAYLDQLDRHGPQKVARALHRIAAEHESDSLVMLCHEGLSMDCHRSTFAAWWLARVGEVVTEVN